MDIPRCWPASLAVVLRIEQRRHLASLALTFTLRANEGFVVLQVGGEPFTITHRSTWSKFGEFGGYRRLLAEVEIIRDDHVAARLRGQQEGRREERTGRKRADETELFGRDADAQRNALAVLLNSAARMSTKRSTSLATSRYA